MGLVAMAARPYVDEPTSYVTQMWGSHRLSEAFKLSGVVAIDTNALAGGVAAAWLPLRKSWLTAGLEAELGYAWFSLGIPMAIELGDVVSIYTAPRLGNWGEDLITPSIPAGISIDLVQGWALRAEGQVRWADLKSYNRQLQLGLAIAYQFGEISR
jgi:hypothetical protein